MTDHHDDFGFFGDHHEPVPFDDTPGHDDTPLPDHDDPDEWLGGHDDFPGDTDGGDDAADHLTWAEHTGGDDDAEPVDPVDTAADHVEVFPPALDVGELPEPVDGFPWIDTASLGVADPAATVEHVEPVRPEELAAYAGETLEPGADPWSGLTGSDDPATSALARWWSQN